MDSLHSVDSVIIEETVSIIINYINDIRMRDNHTIDNDLFIHLTKDKLRKWLTETTAS